MPSKRSSTCRLRHCGRIIGLAVFCVCVPFSSITSWSISNYTAEALFLHRRRGSARLLSNCFRNECTASSTMTQCFDTIDETFGSSLCCCIGTLGPPRLRQNRWYLGIFSCELYIGMAPDCCVTIFVISRHFFYWRHICMVK